MRNPKKTYVSFSLEPSLNSSSLGCLLVILLPALEVALEPAGELVIEECRDCALRDTVFPPSRACLRRLWPYMASVKFRMGKLRVDDDFVDAPPLVKDANDAVDDREVSAQCHLAQL